MDETATSARARWRASGRVVELSAGARRHRIFVREAGSVDGSPVLFFHGFPSSSWDWAHIEPALAPAHRLCTFDFLGFGASAKPRDHRYSIDEQALLAESVAAHFGLDRFHLVAHDYGTTVALALLAQPALAARLRSLTLLNGGLYSALHRPVRVQKLLRSPLGPLVARFMTKRRFMAAMQSVLSPTHRFHQAEIDAQWEAIAENGGNRLGHRLIHYIDDRKKHGAIWARALETTAVPVAFIWGLLDPVSGAHVIDYVESRLAQTPTVTRLADVGHYPQIEAPERVAAALEGFLAAH